MARVSMAAAAIGVASFFFCAPAYSEPVACAPGTCCGCGPLDPDPLALPPLETPRRAELDAVLASGAAATVVSSVAAVLLARNQPHSIPAVDDIPVAGAVAAAARNTTDQRDTPLLLFTAGVQAMGLLVIAAAATDLAELRRLQLDLEAGPGGCGAAVTLRFP